MNDDFRWLRRHRLQHVKEGARGEDGHAGVGADCQEPLVASDQEVGFGGDGGGQDKIVLGVRRDSGNGCGRNDDFGQRSYRVLGSFNMWQRTPRPEIWLAPRSVELGQDVWRDNQLELIIKPTTQDVTRSTCPCIKSSETRYQHVGVQYGSDHS
jgi:hypothetical protein